jgi:hypothetical protein
MVFGLALVMALVVGVASMAFGANGGTFVLGKLNNAATAVTGLVGNVDGGAALRVTNPNTGTNDTALDLRVGAGEAPMRVDSAGKVANLNADRVDGRDFSAFGAQEVLSQPGPLPLEGNYTSKGGTLIISASGSGYRATASARQGGRIGMDVFVDGLFQGLSRVITNERDSHKAFVPGFLVVEGLPAGPHTIRLEAVYDSGVCNSANETIHDRCTTTDGNDSFGLTVMEIPD